MIRSATVDDLPAVMTMARQFVATTSYHSHIAIDPERLMALMGSLIADADKSLLVSEGPNGLNGMIAMVVFEHPFSGVKTGTELCWWVNPDARGSLGIRLLRSAQTWAVEQGVINMQMIAPTPDVERIYQRLGFERVETLYQKVLVDGDRNDSSDSPSSECGVSGRGPDLRIEETGAGIPARG